MHQVRSLRTEMSHHRARTERVTWQGPLYSTARTPTAKDCLGSNGNNDTAMALPWDCYEVPQCEIHVCEMYLVQGGHCFVQANMTNLLPRSSHCPGSAKMLSSNFELNFAFAFTFAFSISSSTLTSTFAFAFAFLIPALQKVQVRTCSPNSNSEL